MLMRSYNKTYSIVEYGGLKSGTSWGEYQGIPDSVFDALEAFILANAYGNSTDVAQLLSLSVRPGIGKVITARNYVGLVAMTDGTVIEILPKIAGDGISISETKQIFLTMLKSVKDIIFKDFNVAALHVDRINLLEIFIKMFLDEVATLTKKGLKGAYSSIEENHQFCKGKILVVQNIKQNLLNKERFFIRYDEFGFD